jgi:MraZ protein
MWGITPDFRPIIVPKWDKCEQMFLGEFTHSIDSKGRLTIPAKFRGDLAAGLVVTRGFDRNLMMFPLSSWKTLAEEMMSRPLSDLDMRTFRRRVFSAAMDLAPDRQGRILLPQYLRDFAGIDDEVVITGMYNYLEIWSVETWENERDAIENSDDAARWSALGI